MNPSDPTRSISGVEEFYNYSTSLVQYANSQDIRRPNEIWVVQMPFGAYPKVEWYNPDYDPLWSTTIYGWNSTPSADYYSEPSFDSLTFIRQATPMGTPTTYPVFNAPWVQLTVYNYRRYPPVAAGGTGTYYNGPLNGQIIEPISPPVELFNYSASVEHPVAGLDPTYFTIPSTLNGYLNGLPATYQAVSIVYKSGIRKGNGSSLWPAGWYIKYTRTA
jgi:hypothetical protein